MSDQPVVNTGESTGESTVEITSRRERVPIRTILAVFWIFTASSVLLILLFQLRHLIFNVVIAVFLALVVNPAVVWLQRHRFSRGWAIVIVSITLFLAVSGIGAAIAAPLATQGANVATHAPTYLRQAEQGRGPLGRLAHRVHLEKEVKRVAPTVSRSLSKLSSRLVDVGRGIASAAARTAIVIVLAIFILVEGPRTVTAIRNAIPPERRAAADRIGRHAAQTVSAYTIGILAMAILNGLITAAALWTMRVPFVLPLAMWAGVVDILPIVGGLLGITVAALFAFTKSIAAGIVVVVVMLLWQQIKNHFLYPVVVGRAVRLNALIVLVSVLAGAELAGISGAILAIPVAAVIHVALTELVGPHLRWMVEDAPTHEATPRPATDPSAGA
jgi:predicted PurR-regulated permease PerM